MKFVVHDHRNNNLYLMSRFKTAVGGFKASNASVNLTDQGLCFFTLYKGWQDDAKWAFASILNEKLKKYFGTGLSAVTCAASDCTTDKMFREFCLTAKMLDNEIKTIQIGETFSETGADFIEKDTFAKTNILLPEIIGVTEEDKRAPPGGWQEFEGRMNDLYEEVRKETVAQRGRPLDLKLV